MRISRKHYQYFHDYPLSTSIAIINGTIPGNQTWVCLKIGYTSNYSHLVGIMIINQWVWGYTIFRQTHMAIEIHENSMTPLWITFNDDSGEGSWNKKFSGFTSRWANLQPKHHPKNASEALETRKLWLHQTEANSSGKPTKNTSGNATSNLSGQSY